VAVVTRLSFDLVRAVEWVLAYKKADPPPTENSSGPVFHPGSRYESALTLSKPVSQAPQVEAR